MEKRIVFFHDIDSQGKRINFQYVAVDATENVNSSKGSCNVIFIDGVEKEAMKENIIEINQGSIFFGVLNGGTHKLPTLGEFKKKIEKFFKQKNIKVSFV